MTCRDRELSQMSKITVASVQEVIMQEMGPGISESLPLLDPVFLPLPGWRPAPWWKRWKWTLARGLLRLVPRITFDRGTYRGDCDD